MGATGNGNTVKMGCDDRKHDILEALEQVVCSIAPTEHDCDAEDEVASAAAKAKEMIPTKAIMARDENEAMQTIGTETSEAATVTVMQGPDGNFYAISTDSSVPKSGPVDLGDNSIPESPGQRRASVAATAVMIICVVAAVIFLTVVNIRRIRKYWVRRKKKKSDDPDARLADQNTDLEGKPALEMKGEEEAAKMSFSNVYSPSAADIFTNSNYENPTNQPYTSDFNPSTEKGEQVRTVSHSQSDHFITAKQDMGVAEKQISSGSNEAPPASVGSKYSQAAEQQHPHKAGNGQALFDRATFEDEMLPEIQLAMTRIFDT